MRKKKGSKERTIIGYVTATDWDLDDVVSEVSIETDSDDYVVEDSGLGKELFDLLGEEVEVAGTVTEDGDGIKYIRVISYKLIESDGDNDEFMN